MNDTLETIEYKDHTINIYSDTDPESPREWDNLGTMLCFHKRYSLGDKTELKSDDFSSWDEVENYIVKELKAVVVLPLYLYDHSGLTIKIGSFYGLLPQGHAHFDSGQVGFIYATKKDIKDNWGIKRITKKKKDHTEKILRGEVETYDQYLRGDVYGYMIEGELSQDSCWGFYGMEEAINEAKSIVDYCVKEDSQKVKN